MATETWESRASAPDNGRVERRSGVDRRIQGCGRLRYLLFGGRRANGRRYADRQRMMYLDRYHQSQFSVIALILFLSMMDALLTLDLVNQGAIELNPIMAFYLGIGPYTFLFVKYGLTSAGVLLLLLSKNFFLKSIRVRVGDLLYLVLAAFMGVVSWQIYLMHKVVV